MDNPNPCQKLIQAARAIPPDDRVPHAFEKRIMARLAGMTVMDSRALWAQALGRAAVFCVALMVLLAVGAVLLPSASPETSLPQAVENVLLAGVDNGADQIGDAR